MAARPDVSGWEKSNDEYSSRFTLPNTINSGINFATVVNVRTGQRQLYQETIFGRNLLKTTNSDGSIVPPNEQTKKNLSLFRFTYSSKSQQILEKAEKASKQASIIVINEASTPEEKANLKKTKEFKSGLNTENQDPNNNESSQISFEFETENVSTKTPVGKGTAIYYPIDIKDTQQDRIKFTAVSLAERTIQNPLEYKSVGGDVYVSIQGPISDSNIVGWGDSKLKPEQAGLFNVAGELIGDGDDKKGDVTKMVGKQLGELKGNVTNLTAALAANNLDLFARATQQVFNPSLELIFKEPKLRQFSFSFKMSARSDTEAESIKKIIKYFKYHMAVKGKGGDLFLKAPDVFWIEYQKGTGETHESLNLIAPGEIKRKACALQSFNVNYTPLGTYMTYDDKECTMVQYDLQFAFSEITPLYQSDYEDDFVADHPIGY
jgi:hypothetical protein